MMAGQGAGKKSTISKQELLLTLFLGSFVVQLFYGFFNCGFVAFFERRF